MSLYVWPPCNLVFLPRSQNRIPLNQEIISKLKTYIAGYQEIVLVTHTNPDGDALGSTLALSRFLSKAGHKVNVMVPNAFPAFLAWMPGSREILNWETEEDRCRALITQSNLVFCLDFNALHRLDGLGTAVQRSSAHRILIDHHIDPSGEFDLIISDVQYSSTSEMVYEVIRSLDGLDRMDPDIAVNIFVGIMTDTGSFSYACNRPETFSIVAELIRYGVNPEKVHRLVYDTYSEHRMRLLGHSLGDRLRVFPQWHTAYIFLTAKDLEDYNFQKGDTEGLVNYPLSIQDINLSVIFIEKEDHIRLSLRSKGSFSVNDFVRKHFEGGGHRNAAGGNAYLSMEETLQRFESLLPQYSKELKKAAL